MSQPFFEYFSSTRIISLKRRTDRRREINSELKRIGQKVDGLTVSWFDAIAPKTADGFPSIGAKGCFLSHLEVLRSARNDDVERLLILEDDAHFIKDFQELQESLISNLKIVDWDIFYAGYTPVVELPRNRPVAAIAPETALQDAHAMAMSRAAIRSAVPYLEAILNREPGSSEGGPMHVDGAYNWFRSANKDLKTIIANPKVIIQRSSVSDITPSSGLKSAVATKLKLRRIMNFLK